MEMIKEEDIKTEPASVEVSAEDNAEVFDPLQKLHGIKIEKTSVESSTKVAENGSRTWNKRRNYSAIGAAFHKVLASMEMDDVDKVKVPLKSPPLPPAQMTTKVFRKAASAPEQHSQYACELCHKSFGVRASLITHMQVHNMGSNRSVTHKKQTAIADALRKSLGLEAETTNLRLVCLHCMAAFELPSQLKTHLLRHLSDLNCDGCLKNMVQEAYLEQTIKITACPHKELPRKWNYESCADNFHTEVELKQHLKIHLDHSLECSFCGAGFPHLADLSKHLEQHVTLDDVYVCKICQKMFTKYHYLALHSARHKSKHTRTLRRGGGSKLSAPLCAESGEIVLATHFRGESSDIDMRQEFGHEENDEIYPGTLQAHVRPKQPSFHRNKPYKCVICQRRFATKYALRRHGFVDWICGLKNVRSKSHECHSCQRCYREVRAFRLHMKEHKENPEGLQKRNNAWYICRLCYKTFRGILTLNSHMRRHESRSYPCELCGALFALPSELSEHLASLHTRKPYRCRLCPGKYQSISSLRLHRAEKCRDARLVRSRYYCLSCNKLFKILEKALEHQQLHLMNPKELPYACSYCNAFFIYGYVHQNHLEAHLKDFKTKSHILEMNRLATESKSYVRCKVCQRLFLNLHRLDEHMKSHGKRTCDCERCGAIFAKPVHLEDHKAKLHGKQQYECSSCFRPFSRMSSLYRHYRRNALKRWCTRKKLFQKQKYACISCKKGFNSASLFAKHYELHCQEPKELPYACGYCNAHFIYPKLLIDHLLRHECQNVVEPKAPAHKRTGRGKRTSACEMCGAIFAEPADLKNHKAQLHSKQPYECSRCYRKFSLMSGLQRHEDRAPMCSRKPFLKKKYACISCKKGFDNGRLFAKHHKLHCQDPEELPYACGYCNARFIYERHHTSHQHKCSKNLKVVVEPEPHVPSDVDSGHGEVEHEYEVVVVKEDQDSRSWSNGILQIATSEDSYTIAIDSMEWLVQVESTEDGENMSPEETCNMEISLSPVKIERTASIESLLNPAIFAIKEERLAEEEHILDPKAVEIKTEFLEENATNDMLNVLIKDEEL